MRVRVAVLALGLLLVAPSIAPRDVSAATPSGAALVRALATRRLSNVKFDDTKLEGVLTYLRVATGWNFVLKRAPIAKEGIDLDTVTAKFALDDVSVATVLELVLEPCKLVAVVRDNIIYVTTKADALGKPVLVLYPITQLTWQKTDFRGPDLDLHPSGYVVPDAVEPESPVEDDPFLDPQHIVDLVKEMVDTTWDADGWSITATKQHLIVKAPRSIQRQVAKVIAVMEGMK